MTQRESERSTFLRRSAEGLTVPVARAFPAGNLSPLALFRRMRASHPECFLLESVEGSEHVARYTFVGCGPVARLVLDRGAVEIERNGLREALALPPLAALERMAISPGFRRDSDLPPLAAGAVGFLSYDAVRFFEQIPDRHAREGGIPDGVFLAFDAVAAFDHARGRLLLMTTVDRGRGAHGNEAVAAAVSRLDALERFLDAPDPTEPAGSELDSDAPTFAAAGSRQRFLESVARAREAIFAGEVYQVVLSQRWSAPLGADPLDVYEELRRLNPSPYLFYLQTREAVVFGASPEMLVRCRDGVVETRPIAGTVPRGAEARVDRELADRLLADPKERAEHVMLVDLARNDLGRVCAIGSVEVSRYAAVEKYSHVQHLVSDVRGRLAQGKTAADALAACFPAGTLTGAPKIRAMELIDELEESRRGVYGGAIGYLDAGGNLDMAIAIRTAVLEDGVCRIQAGAGIVADSIPENEYREAESKAAALFRAVELARRNREP